MIHPPALEKVKVDIQTRKYEMMADFGGMEIPMNPPRGQSQNERLRNMDGEYAADFPEVF